MAKGVYVKRSFASILLVRLIYGNVDFTLQAHRARALIKGLKKREGMVRKQPFNTDLPWRTHKELVCKSAARIAWSESMHFELYAARILGFFYLLRISELVGIKWEDNSVDTHDGRNYLAILSKKYKTDIFKDGILRARIEIDSVLCQVKTSQ